MFLFGADVRAQEAPTATSLRASAFGAENRRQTSVLARLRSPTHLFTFVTNCNCHNTQFFIAALACAAATGPRLRLTLTPDS